MDNPGLKLGLAQNFGYDQKTEDLARQQQQMRQAQMYAENKAKMMADDFDYNNAMNAWDNAAVKGFAQDQVKKIGKFITENPDYTYNVEKRGMYNMMVKELKDNPALNTGLQVDSNIKAMQQYVNDPKNAPLANSPEFMHVKNELANYLKTGSVDGVSQNRKIFQFVPPEEYVDTTPVFAKYAQSVGLNGKDTKHLGRGAASIHQFVSSQDKALAAQGVVNDKDFGRHVQREYNDYLSKQDGSKKPLTIDQYALNKMAPYFKGDEYHNYNYHVSDKGGSGSGGGQTGTGNPFAELINRAHAGGKQNLAVAADPNGIDQILTGGKGGLNTNGMMFELSPGNFVPFKAGVLGRDNFTFSGTKVKYDDNGARASVVLTMTPEEFERSVGDQPLDAIDEKNWFGFGLSNTEWNSGYDKGGARLTKDKDGKDVVEVTVWKPLEATNQNTAMGYNHGLHGKAEEVNSYNNPGVESGIKVSPDGTMYQDTSTGIIYDSKTRQPIK